MNAHFYRVERQTEPLSYYGVFEVLNVSQPDELGVGRGERRHRVSQRRCRAWLRRFVRDDLR
jgi:hypothetical protein